MQRTRLLCLILLVCATGLVSPTWAAESEETPAAAQTTNAAQPSLTFNRDIRPLLSDRCFACHGPDKNTRKADLRLDLRDAAISQGAIVPGASAESELVRRIHSDDPEQQMPPPGSGKELSAEERQLLSRWIDEGAEYQPHWAYLPPVRHEFPADLSSHPIDAWIYQQLKQVQIAPAPEASRATLIRRLSLDLTGLPPTPAEVAQFLADDSEQAYESLVDRLLSSPHFGERMALFWLDIVRYADTIGYHSDNPMQVSPYRDYVIASFNQNKPFDEFTIEQIAGDLLPSATRTQLTASAYNRLLQTTEEGGAQPKEYEAKYAADRVRNIGSAWLGVTLGCCQCHDHKYDPFTTRDFYSMAAYFADIQEAAVGARGTGTLLASDEQQQELQDWDARVAAAQQQQDACEQRLVAEQPRWEAQLGVTEPLPSEAAESGLLEILATPAAERTAEQQQQLKNFYLQQSAELASLKAETARQTAGRQTLLATIPTCLTTQSGPPRTVRILPRGNWLDETGEVVLPSTPAVLFQQPISGERGTRLDLAKWLVAPENPLTARVFVNRVWKLFMGQGLSRSLEDIGMQGELPSHPELLDWLAVDFRESGWDVKRLVKRIVMSATYRQTSDGRPDLQQIDPQNRWLARQNRFRLEAELIRDHALAVSGLLVRELGGPSVKPYQPAGYWVALNFPTREWEASTGAGLYRRGLYTHWQRSFLHPSLLAFDAPSREECVVDRPRSNLPQQALTLLNDPTYVEAARALAARTLSAASTPAARVAWAFEQVVQRPARAEEIQALLEFVQRQQDHYSAHPALARELLGVGAWQPPAELGLGSTPDQQAADKQAADWASWTAVGRVLLSLHESITRF